MKPGRHVILMGAQGAGKGTQAERLAPALNLVHFSTGEAFRAAIGAQTELGVMAKGYLDRGDLVPDEVTVGIVAAKLGEIAERATNGGPTGALFDGFPRTRAQAEGLATELTKRGERIAAVVELAVPRDQLVQRLSGRRVCPKCGSVYHMEHNPPQNDSICDKDGAHLEQRADDTPEAIERRLNLYDEMTSPLLEYYREQGLLRRVNGIGAIDDIQRAIVAEIRGTEA